MQDKVMTERESKAWKALDGYRLGDYRIRLGQYDNGRPGATVVDLLGIPECKMTVNLWDEADPGEGRFHVRTEDLKYAKHVFDLVQSHGIAKPTGLVADTNGGEYAEIWQLCAAEGWNG